MLHIDSTSLIIHEVCQSKGTVFQMEETVLNHLSFWLGEDKIAPNLCKVHMLKSYDLEYEGL